jgi:hypothetical protein
MMSARHKGLTVLASATVLCLLCVPGSAQIILSGQTPSQNLALAVASEHAPGNMVSAGLARAAAAVRQPGQVFEITETERSMSFGEHFQSQALVGVVQELMDTINYLISRILERAGLSTDTSTDPDSSTDGDGTDGGDDATDGDASGDDTDSTDGDGGRRPGGRVKRAAL